MRIIISVVRGKEDERWAVEIKSNYGNLTVKGDDQVTWRDAELGANQLVGLLDDFGFNAERGGDEK